MRRRLVIASILGLATAIAAAAVLIWRRPWPSSDQGGILHLDRRGGVWMGSDTSGVGWRALSIWPATGVTDHGRTLAEPLPAWAASLPGSPEELFVIERVGGGWPMTAVAVERTGRDDTDAHFARTGVHTTGIGPASVIWNDWTLGGMAWVGLVVDATLFTLPWLGLVSIPAMRRASRRRRGRCPTCSYDLRGTDSPDCPECGAALATASR